MILGIPVHLCRGGCQLDLYSYSSVIVDAYSGRRLSNTYSMINLENTYPLTDFKHNLKQFIERII